MDATLVTYSLEGAIATITLDDGKRNALGPPMLTQLNAALERAEEDGVVVILTGREGVFSAGFDLKVMGQGGLPAMGMLRAGYELTERLLSFPTPVVMACTGHAIAMGVFTLLCGDYRIGAQGPFKFSANEVAIGMTMPRVLAAVARQRLTPAEFSRSMVLAEAYSPEAAQVAGYLDRVVPVDQVGQAAAEVAMQLAKLDMRAHRETKLRVRQETLRRIRASMKLDLADVLLMGVKQMVKAKTGKPRTAH